RLVACAAVGGGGATMGPPHVPTLAPAAPGTATTHALSQRWPRHGRCSVARPGTPVSEEDFAMSTVRGFFGLKFLAAVAALGLVLCGTGCKSSCAVIVDKVNECQGSNLEP